MTRTTFLHAHPTEIFDVAIPMESSDLAAVRAQFTHAVVGNLRERELSYEIVLKPSYTSVIPLKLFQTWHTLDLPPGMAANVAQLRADNPEFEYQLFDDAMCRAFIADHFEADVVAAFDALVPGAFKADLWRYCVLFVHGGIYVDIKYRCVHGFKLVALTEREYLVRDLSNHGVVGVYNALMVCRPQNPLLGECIRRIVQHCHIRYYGDNYLCPTGPHLMRTVLDNLSTEAIETWPLHLYADLDQEGRSWLLTYYAIRYTLRVDDPCVTHYAMTVMEAYPEYRVEQVQHSLGSDMANYYPMLWYHRGIYR